MQQHRVIILGGYGVFGGLIAGQLAGDAGIELVIAGRDSARGTAFAQRIGARFVCCDLREAAGLRTALAGAFLVIHTAGPFGQPGHPVARACLEVGAHYLDIADEPSHVAAIGALDAEARCCGLFLCAGASSTPGISAAMVRALTADGLRPTRIATALSPGNRNPRGIATVGSFLRYLGEPVQVTLGGRLVQRYGWHNGATLTFPPPVGRRRVYTVDTPDTRLFPARFGASSVTFKAGLELPPLNWMLSALARLRRLHLLPNLSGQARLLTLLSWATYTFGSSRGAAAVWLEGQHEDQTLRRSLALVAERDGPIVAASPALLLARRLLAGKHTARGAAPCIDQLDFDELAALLAGFGVRAVWGDGRGWQSTA